MTRNPQGATIDDSPDRINDPTSAIIKLAKAYTLSHSSFLRQPNIVMTASGSVVAGSIQATRPGDTNPNGYHYPYLIAYNPASPPAAGDRMVVHNSPSGPFILGRLSSASSTSTAFSDPETSVGDMMYRNASNVTDRLSIGTVGQVLTVVNVSGSLLPVWQTPLTDPLTTIGDLNYRNASNVTTRLPIGSTNQVLTVISGLPTWSTGMSNPMSNIGDMITGTTAGAPAAIAAVAVGQTLISQGVTTQPIWSSNLSLSGTLGVTGTTSLGTLSAGSTTTTSLTATTGSFSGNVQVNSLQIPSSGTVITKLAVYSVTATCGAVSGNSTASQSFTVTGLTTSDKILFVNKGTYQIGLAIVGHSCGATDTLNIVWMNCTAGSITPTAGDTYKIVALRS